MNATQQSIEQAQQKIAEAIRNAPAEKREEIRIFLEGYAAGLEHILGKQTA
jgi:hypothetical protein